MPLRLFRRGYLSARVETDSRPQRVVNKAYSMTVFSNLADISFKLCTKNSRRAILRVAASHRYHSLGLLSREFWLGKAPPSKGTLRCRKSTSRQIIRITHIPGPEPAFISQKVAAKVPEGLRDFTIYLGSTGALQMMGFGVTKNSAGTRLMRAPKIGGVVLAATLMVSSSAIAQNCTGFASPNITNLPSVAGNTATVASTIASSISSVNLAFLTQSSAFVSAPGNPSPWQDAGGTSGSRCWRSGRREELIERRCKYPRTRHGP